MKILVAGGTGFIGKALVRALIEAGHDVIVLGRSIPKIQFCFGDSVRAWSFRNLETSKETLDIVINLSGETLVGLWTRKKQEKIRDSRLGVTKRLVAFCVRQNKITPVRLLQASAVGIYGLRGERTYYENKSIPPTRDFLSEIATALVDTALEASRQGVATTLMRFGVVLGFHGGMLEYMLPLYRAGLGAVLGNGQQKISWITREDLVKAIFFLIDHPELTGPVNCVAKEPVSQKELAERFARYLHRPLWLRIPRFLIHLFLGKMGDTLLLGSQMVEPYRLLDAGFEFDYPNLNYYFARRKNP